MYHNNHNKTIDDYEPIVGANVIDQLRRLADKLDGARVLHVNSTSKGGGVAEILGWMVPILKNLGIDSRWQVIKGDESFFNVTKNFHNALQGVHYEISQEAEKVYKNHNEENASSMNLDSDYVFIHDPQPAPLIEHRTDGIWIWRCHIDISKPYPPVWNFLKRYVTRYNASIFSMPQFAQNLPIPQYLVPPSIDPLSEKNKRLTKEEIAREIDRLEITHDKPILLQVSRFDRFKDPIGVIKAYKLVKKHEDCILVLAGSEATDDPEGPAVLDEVKKYAAEDTDIHILMLPPFSDLQINALQREADIIIQKSLKEGFGLTVTEGMWKGKPVVCGAVGGISTQIKNGVNGYLINSIEGTAYRTRQLLHHPDLAASMGYYAREYVRHNFLLTRHIRDYLSIMIATQHPNETYIQV
ncbi:MAG: glycosyltransferase [Methanosarcinales archaeon]|nr:MAG: glycosyltransferase [Methanosarcinales archaeon]